MELRHAWPVLLVLTVSVTAPVSAQERDQTSMQEEMQMSMAPGEQHQPAMPEQPLDIDEARDGSGTSWVPDRSPMRAAMRTAGAWSVMVHGNAFVQVIKTGSDRGDLQVGSINWIMGMAQRTVGGGQLEFRGMFSAEPLTVGRCGYPTLLQTGESCEGAALHDRQHPHDFFMELAVDYRRGLSKSLAVEVYGGPSAEPALGPTAYPHRWSALPNLTAPITHHWLDSSHISFGVVTGGLYGRRWKAEASIFNGREPDDRRYGLDLAALDSYAGRVWWLPTPQVAMQVSAGHLKANEALPSGSREDVDRVTASATYHRLVNDRIWATTVAWGRNREADRWTSGFLIESAADLTVRDLVFARGEIVAKTAAELVVPLSLQGTLTVSKFQLGFTRWLIEAHGVKTGIGGSGAVSVVPESLKPFYGGRAAGEFSVFLTVRPN